MKALCNRKRLLDAFGMVAGVVPARSPKPILQNVKLVVEPDEGSILIGTDSEVGIRSRVLGVKVDQPGSAVLPTQRMNQILRASSDDELMIDTRTDCRHPSIDFTTWGLMAGWILLKLSVN